MADLFEYITWRGDIPFSQVPVNNVDALLFSALVYINFDGIVTTKPNAAIPLHSAADAFFALEDTDSRIRVKNDLTLLRTMAQSPRYRDIGLSFYQNLFIPEEETQFAALSFLLPDGSAFLAFRGTDTSLVGWKEDFNMSFQDTVPAQQEALRYTQAFAANNQMILRLGGHSKGGNLAVFAAAKCGLFLQKRIAAVFNNDGPGFTEYLMGDAGYLAMVPKIRTFIPESSIIGMLLEHEEPYRVIKSRQISLLQHEPYSWEVLGGDFIYADAMSSETVFMGNAIKSWLRSMNKEERSTFVDGVYDLLSSSGANTVDQLIEPKALLQYIKTIHTNNDLRQLLSAELTDLAKIVKGALSRRLSEKEIP
ncbi:MAG: DUF2974 domain-containing protein [Oscillospiraceae bacterium]|nr:DUF2974 domain-containing protein [Oscillospiraceae bacterium]